MSGVSGTFADAAAPMAVQVEWHDAYDGLAPAAAERMAHEALRAVGIAGAAANTDGLLAKAVLYLLQERVDTLRRMDQLAKMLEQGALCGLEADEASRLAELVADRVAGKLGALQRMPGT